MKPKNKRYFCYKMKGNKVKCAVGKGVKSFTFSLNKLNKNNSVSG